jgi:hypothetical protein
MGVLEKDQLPISGNPSTPVQSPPTTHPIRLRLLHALVRLRQLVLLCFALSLLFRWLTVTLSVERADAPSGGIQWTTCGENFECANVSVPLDYHNASDERTVTVAVNRFLATDHKHRHVYSEDWFASRSADEPWILIGKVPYSWIQEVQVFLSLWFLRGFALITIRPGGSGIRMVYQRGRALSTILKGTWRSVVAHSWGIVNLITTGQFDIIGFDPRGVNQTWPYVSCFSSQLEADAFEAAYDLELDLPAHISAFMPALTYDLERQIARAGAATAALAKKCRERTGPEITFMGE